MSINTGYYSLQAAAIAAGVEPNTLRAWESRYRIVEPQRSAAGHRRYSPEAVQRLQVIAALVRKGHAISALAKLNDRALSKLTASPAVAPVEPQLSRAVRERRDQLLDAVRGYDLTRVAASVKWLRAVTGARSFVLNVVGPIFDEMGKLVAASSFDVAQEHALSAVLRDQIGDLLQTLQALAVSPAAGGRIVFACPEGDLHEFGVLLSAVLAAARGQEIVYAGPNLPVNSLARVVKACKARTVVLGNAPVPPSDRRVSFEAYLAALDAAVPVAVNVLVGGSGDRPIRAFSSARTLRYVNSLQELDDIWSENESAIGGVEV